MSPEKSIPMEQGSSLRSEAHHDTPMEQVLNTSSQWKQFLFALAILVVCFILPLFQLAAFAWGDDLYSYIVLVPFITVYLAWQKRHVAVAPSAPRRSAGLALAILGVLTLGIYFGACARGVSFHVEDRLALFTLAFEFLFFGAAVGLLGRETFKALSFPFAMMLFLVPIPVFAREALERFLQYGSAYCAQAMFKLSALPIYRDELVFYLPGLPFGIRVAPECSGIHSTLILFITSLLAGHLFLRKPWNRFLLAGLVLPLGLLRNGFRVFTIGQLCVHFGPKMIDSPIHHKGGPLFFALSLIPFFALLVFLYKRERRPRNKVEE